MLQFFLFCQSLASVLPKTFNIFLMFRFIGGEFIWNNYYMKILAPLLYAHRSGDGSLICYKTLKVYEVC